LWAVQTPQCFGVAIIRKALDAVRQKGLHLTDDTAACEMIGQPVRLVAGLGPNPKLTSPEDVHYLKPMIESAGWS
jgi:2-C-methyl-D-erythritol 4-phosphate cytidylyltransferase